MQFALLVAATLGIMAGASSPAASHDIFAPLPDEADVNSLILPEEIASVEDLLRIRYFQRSGLIAPLEDNFFNEEFDPQAEAGGVENVFLQSHRWDDRHHFRICFFDGTERERQAVRDAFDYVLDHTNLRASFYTGVCPIDDGKGGTLADIQIMIHAGTCGSNMGKMSLARLASADADNGPNNPTMFLCKSTNFKNAQQRRVLLHEIMHAIGFVHELQHVGQQCWNHLNEDAVKRHYVSTLSAADQDKWFEVNYRPLTEYLNAPQLAMTAFDYESIMLYPTRSEFWKPGTPPICFDANANTWLSAGDKDMLRRVYPQNAAERMVRSARLALRADDDLLRQVIVASVPEDHAENPAIDECFAEELCLDDLRAEIIEQLMPGPVIFSDLVLMEEPGEQPNVELFEAQARVAEAIRVPGDDHMPADPVLGICRQNPWCFELLSAVFETMNGGPTASHATLRDGLIDAMRDNGQFAAMLGIDYTSLAAGLSTSATSDCLADDMCAGKFRDTIGRALDLNSLGPLTDFSSIPWADEWECTGPWCDEVDRLLGQKVE